MESNGVLLVSLKKQRPDSNFSRSQKKNEEKFFPNAIHVHVIVAILSI